MPVFSVAKAAGEITCFAVAVSAYDASMDLLLMLSDVSDLASEIQRTFSKKPSKNIPPKPQIHRKCNKIAGPRMNGDKMTMRSKLKPQDVKKPESLHEDRHTKQKSRRSTTSQLYERMPLFLGEGDLFAFTFDIIASEVMQDSVSAAVDNFFRGSIPRDTAQSKHDEQLKGLGKSIDAEIISAVRTLRKILEEDGVPVRFCFQVLRWRLSLDFGVEFDHEDQRFKKLKSQVESEAALTTALDGVHDECKIQVRKNNRAKLKKFLTSAYSNLLTFSLLSNDEAKSCWRKRLLKHEAVNK